MPLYKFTIDSQLAASEVSARLKGLIREKPRFWPDIKGLLRFTPKYTPPFYGEVEGNTFSLRRDIRYRNSFLPLIRGEFVSSAHGTQIKVAMNLHPLVIVFMVVWLGFAATGAISLAADKGITPALIPIGMCLFAIALTFVGFIPEAIKARRILEDELMYANPPI